MSIFKKRGPETIDLTELQKKGTLQRSQKLEKSNSDSLNLLNKNIVDLTLKKPKETSDTQPSTEEISSPLSDFLSNLASANSSQESGIQAMPPESSTPSDISSIKIKLEDIEFKLDNFITRLQKIEEKIGKI